MAALADYPPLLNFTQMEDAISTAEKARKAPPLTVGEHARAAATPTFLEPALALASSLLLVISFPDFELWPLAWVALVPLLLVIANKPHPWRALFLGSLMGATFFYGSCHWLTFSMIHYGGIPSWLAYLLLIPGALILGLFPGMFAWTLARAIRNWGHRALFAAPFIWTTLEWVRLEISGQLWNAIGYSQAFEPWLIQAARWGGIYAIGFLVLSVNAAVAYAIAKRTLPAIAVSAAVLSAVATISLFSYVTSSTEPKLGQTTTLHVIALQPNVPMDLSKSSEQLQELTKRHVVMSESALALLPNDGVPRLVIWPESPMNFAYGVDADFRQLVSSFARENKILLLFNSQEPAPNAGLYNSALLLNEQGNLLGQYDKIRLLPFGEYVPLPRWLPGASLITAIVGDFTPGRNYSLLPMGFDRAGVFICIESAYPFIARRFTNEGASLLINISNDGYLGRTAVMRQHLANAVFRAVENTRPILRVTNTGITAYISPAGEIRDMTAAFQPAVRTWTIKSDNENKSFYAVHGDIFARTTLVITMLVLLATFVKRPSTLRATL